MSTTYAQRQTTAQKKDSSSASSVLDASSQSESLQRKADMANNAVQRAEAPRPNNTGMPDNLKAGIESLSGFSMDDVRVHYNSSKPATVQALAYTQGTDIHVAPGQEKHLPHEAWHVAQQMAGRVSPTTNINGMPVNDNAALEHEADVMGEKAVQCKMSDDFFLSHSLNSSFCSQNVAQNYQPIQKVDDYVLTTTFQEHPKDKSKLSGKMKILDSSSKYCYAHLSCSCDSDEEIKKSQLDPKTDWKHPSMKNGIDFDRFDFTSFKENVHVTLEGRYYIALSKIEEGMGQCGVYMNEQRADTSEYVNCLIEENLSDVKCSSDGFSDDVNFKPDGTGNTLQSYINDAETFRTNIDGRATEMKNEIEKHFNEKKGKIRDEEKNKDKKLQFLDERCGFVKKIVDDTKDKCVGTLNAVKTETENFSQRLIDAKFPTKNRDNMRKY